jgi:multidrug efflux pump
MMAGALALYTLPVAQFPPLAPPEVSIIATYPGASAATVARTVVQVIEQQMSGLDHLEYVSSQSGSDGSFTITLMFAQGTDPNIAQVQVQNQLQLATPLLPQEVQQQGLKVSKADRNFLLVVGLVSDNGGPRRSAAGDFSNVAG